MSHIQSQIMAGFQIAVTCIGDVTGGVEAVKTAARGADFQKASSSVSVLIENIRERTNFVLFSSVNGSFKRTDNLTSCC